MSSNALNCVFEFCIWPYSPSLFIQIMEKNFQFPYLLGYYNTVVVRPALFHLFPVDPEVFHLGFSKIVVVVLLIF
jgi:hypothetical protein